MGDRRLRRHLSQDEMNRDIGMLHSGLSQRHVANVLAGFSPEIFEGVVAFSGVVTLGSITNITQSAT